MLLTINSYPSILNTHSQKTSVGIGLSKLNGVSRFNAVFLCAKSQFIVMLGWVGSRKTGRLRLADRPTYSVRLHDWPHVVGFKNLINGVNLMTKFKSKKPNKKHTLTSCVNPISLFLLLDSQRKTIAQGLTFDQVKPISEHINGSVIKFQKMTEMSL